MLEPTQYARTQERSIRWADLETLARQVRRQRYCRDVLYRGRAGRQLTLIDFKTTSSPDLPHFLATIEKYDYDRQAALYLDALGATRLLIIGVRKKAPHEVWRVELTNMLGLVGQGRKKYQRLLRAHAGALTNGSFTPATARLAA
ncbi:PD-(D/E)XK nuclease-like domain-containing protein [Hymenobacter weizhouensis]|uniref:PD-(D/E)XK nuclease-like domain-containing protein n=1 Tax=Hymenobacter sp. YIM 151500-1 TaxID=2987689 RepID=UPI0022270206|nr:PD-(D/E)XK nuclease-like domain-containing protein [Hymenobacter sp. YIM 151500-1]UYZ64929.1 PD-(D/E)XK nuclease-like domain-containing protein [Hymenobacter sp. YIM 151500-1]